MALLQRAIYNLGQLGFYDFVLPFFLILAVVYGALQSKKPISESVAVNGVIAITVAFLGTYIARGLFYTRIFSGLGMGLAALLVLIVMLSMFGIKPENLFKGFSILKPDTIMLPGLLFLIAAIIFAGAFGMNYILALLSNLSWLFDRDTLLTLLFVAVSIGAIAFVLMQGGGGGGHGGDGGHGDHGGGHH